MSQLAVVLQQSAQREGASYIGRFGKYEIPIAAVGMAVYREQKLQTHGGATFSAVPLTLSASSFAPMPVEISWQWPVKIGL